MPLPLAGGVGDGECQGNDRSRLPSVQREGEKRERRASQLTLSPAFLDELRARTSLSTLIVAGLMLGTAIIAAALATGDRRPTTG
jgi:hypothetical protein